MSEVQDAPEPLAFVPVQPGVDGIGITPLQEAVLSHCVWRLPGSNLQQGCTAFPDIGAGVMVPMVQQFLTLRFIQGKRSTLGHLFILVGSMQCVHYAITDFDCQSSLGSR
jgi:hypothetical protein